MGRVYESLIAKSRSHAEHGNYAQTCSKVFFSRTDGLIFTKLVK